MKFILLLTVPLLFITCNSPSNEDGNDAGEAADSLFIKPAYRLEIENLAQLSSIKTAWNFIEKFDEQTIKNQIQLTEVPAPPFNENKFGKADLFSKLLKEYGSDSVWIDSIGNVIGLRRGMERNKVLAVAGHLDTVFPEETDVKVIRSNDTLFAPGIGDDNRGLAVILTLLHAINENNIRTKNDILFIGDVGEEGRGDLRGMKYLFRDGGLQINAFISIEPGRIDRITNGALGSHRYKVTFSGPGGHSWGSFGLANPIHALGQAISIFTENADAYVKDGEKTSYNVGVIEGGTSVNSIPFSATMEVDMRSLSQKRLEEIDTIFRRAMKSGLERQNKIRRSGDSLTLDIQMVGNRPSGKTDPADPLIQRAMASSLQIDNKEPSLTTSSTDSNIPVSKGIPAVTLGGGGQTGNSHSLHEWYLNTDGYKGIQRALLVIIAQSGLSSDNNENL